MELKRVANYLNGRYLIIDKKKDKQALLSGKLLATCSVDYVGVSKQVVEYYDTPNFSFAEKGINIYTTLSGNTKEIIVRYDSDQVKRIEFLKNIPNFFRITMANKKDRLDKYFEQISTAISQVFPEGLHIELFEAFKQLVVKVTINKKCENYRVVNNNGLKTSFIFSTSSYLQTQPKSKFIQENLEILAESSVDKELFNKFLKFIILDSPQLIRVENNELTYARKNFEK